jgi:hypothetical protein
MNIDEILVNYQGKILLHKSLCSLNLASQTSWVIVENGKMAKIKILLLTL